MTLAIIFDSVGVGEWFVLLAVILIVVGPKRLPSTARKVGAYYSKFRRAADSFKRQLMDMDTEFTQAVNDATQDVQEAVRDVDAELEAAAMGETPPADVEAGSAPAAHPADEAPAGDQAVASAEAETGGDQAVASTEDVPQDQQS